MAIVLNSKTYNYRGFNPQSISTYFETSAGVPSGFSPLTSRVEGTDGSGKVKTRWKLKVPIVAAVDSGCSCTGSVLREAIVDIVVTLERTATAAERTDLQARIVALVQTPEFSGSVINLVQPSS